MIGPEPKEWLSREDKNFLMTSHLDFVVYRRRDHAPVFAVEFDGPHHDSEPQITRDIRKNRLCAEAELPLLRVRDVHLETHEKTTLLDFMTTRFVAWNKERRSMDRDIQARVASMSEAEFEALTEDGVLDPSLDPDFLFNLEHPFPGVRHVSHRLLTRYSILAPYLRRGESGESAKLECRVMCVGEEAASVFESSKLTAYAVYPRSWANRGLEYRGGRFAVAGREPLLEGEVRFAMNWAVPTIDDYNPDEVPIHYQIRTGKMPIVFMGPPGMHIPDIVEWFSEYLALREVEKWASQRPVPA